MLDVLRRARQRIAAHGWRAESGGHRPKGFKKTNQFFGGYTLRDAVLGLPQVGVLLKAPDGYELAALCLVKEAIAFYYPEHVGDEIEFNAADGMTKAEILKVIERAELMAAAQAPKQVTIEARPNEPTPGQVATDPEFYGEGMPLVIGHGMDANGNNIGLVRGLEKFDPDGDGKVGGSKPAEERGMEPLWDEARRRGIRIDKRWGEKRLRRELTKDNPKPEREGDQEIVKMEGELLKAPDIKPASGEK